ncbi:MAG: hypothetical protein WBB85_11070 [Albidovulum sp.]|uniref:hypothetical protein n=1 Tax=Albidovulum sp. TaxID=1872424 RepID=UPI003CB5D2E4
MRRNSRPTVIIGGTESDAHVVSIYIAAYMLEQHGYDVVNLSCQNKTRAFFAANHVSSDVIACIICNQNGHARDDLRDLPECRVPGLPVALAGHYTLGTHNRAEQIASLQALGVDHFLDSLEQLPVLLEELAEQRCVARQPGKMEVLAHGI